MEVEPVLQISPLSQMISSGAKTVKVDIFKLDDEDEWSLEIEDEFGYSIAWDETFKTETAALTEAKRAILAEGISSFVEPEEARLPED
jgi:hypothetical protein